MCVLWAGALRFLITLWRHVHKTYSYTQRRKTTFQRPRYDLITTTSTVINLYLLIIQQEPFIDSPTDFGIPCFFPFLDNRNLYKALYDYEKRSEDDLSFTKDTVLEVTDHRWVWHILVPMLTILNISKTFWRVLDMVHLPKIFYTFCVSCYRDNILIWLKLIKYQWIVSWCTKDIFFHLWNFLELESNGM